MQQNSVETVQASAAESDEHEPSVIFSDAGLSVPGEHDEGYVGEKDNLDPEGVDAKLIPTALMAKYATDKFDPLSLEIQKVKAEYDRLRDILVQVCKANRGLDRTSKSQEYIDAAHEPAIDAYRKVMDLMDLKKKQDATKEEFDVGKYFFVTIVSASHLPKMDKYGACDAYCTFDYQIHRMGQHPPEADGNKTCCIVCENKNQHEKALCQAHRSATAPKSYNPTFNRKYMMKLDDSKSHLLMGIYSWNRTGPHPLIGYLRIPVWAVLYTKETEREYPLSAINGTMMRATAQDANGENYDTFSMIKVRFYYKYKKRDARTVYSTPGADDTKLDGWHIRRWVGGSGYVGNWVDGLPHGEGAFYGGDGSVYEGRWFKARMQGQGRMTFANGDVYEGEWKDGRAHGTGAILRANGRKFDGIWYEGKLCSRGHSRPPTPEGYRGERHDTVEARPEPDDLQDHNYPSLVVKSSKALKTTMLYLHKSGPESVRPYQGDKLMHDEDDDSNFRCFWDRHKESLERMPNYRIVVARDELAVQHQVDVKKKRFRHAAATVNKEPKKPAFDPDSLLQQEGPSTTPKKGFMGRVAGLFSPSKFPSPFKKRGGGGGGAGEPGTERTAVEAGQPR